MKKSGVRGFKEHPATETLSVIVDQSYYFVPDACKFMNNSCSRFYYLLSFAVQCFKLRVTLLLW